MNDKIIQFLIVVGGVMAAGYIMNQLYDQSAIVAAASDGFDK